ncbi:hypothetical protein H312_02046 [Anncaliia algerae PRA339]|uniref:Deacetylase sirtuin-type domain-containing protein n=1 Tax=Anncaliia algerae PRA339 TaxID=1288291 RepID=A0A059F0A5_9MICR|nr:hypothetical protein H312_02046 [Anncaliia algerae PRA339]
MEEIDEHWILKNKKKLINKKCVVITGAGISVSAGIPDFRSKEGIFSHIKKKYNVNGTELFSYSFGLNPSTREIYLKFISEFKELSSSLSPSFSHNALKNFLNYQKKYTVYSQNICGLEKKAGIENLVHLHGDTENLKCMSCGRLHLFTHEHVRIFKEGKEIECIECKTKEKKRPSFRGYLHPNIVHYEEEHPNCAELIDKVIKDKHLNLLIVIGTSLKPYGVKQVIKYFLSNLQHNSNNYISLYINKESPNKLLSSFFTHAWIGSVEDFFKILFDSLNDNFNTKESKSNKENLLSKNNKELLSNLSNKSDNVLTKVKCIKNNISKGSKDRVKEVRNIKIKKTDKLINEENHSLIKSNVNLFQREETNDSSVINSFVEEMSSFLRESIIKDICSNDETLGSNNNKIKDKQKNISCKFKTNEITVNQCNISKDNKSNDTKDYKPNKNNQSSVNKNNDPNQSTKVKDNQSNKTDSIKYNKYRTIIFKDDGGLEVKLPEYHNNTPIKKKITKANPTNYSPLLKKNKEK